MISSDVFRVRDSLGIGQGERDACKRGAKDQHFLRLQRGFLCLFVAFISRHHRFLANIIFFYPQETLGKQNCCICTCRVRVEVSGSILDSCESCGE